jgi:NAD(P)-dependent dehydrogenase (short-subunit alcohol dehydrogenase family)
MRPHATRPHHLPGVIPVRLDVTSPEQVSAAAARCGDVHVLINNAGIALPGGVLAADGLASLQAQIDTHVLGPLRLAQAFAPALAAAGGGAVLNVLSLLSFVNAPALGSYSVSKAAAWGLSNALRNELRAQGTQVLSLHMGFVDTELARGFDAPKSAPQLIAARALDALEAGAEEVLADALSQQLKPLLGAAPRPICARWANERNAAATCSFFLSTPLKAPP